MSTTLTTTPATTSTGSPSLLKLRDQVVYRSEAPDRNYNSFPSAVITPAGKIIVAFRQARDMRHVYGETRHVDCNSRGVLVTSSDGGQTWDTEPGVLYDHFLYGVQDPCINLLRDGTLFGTFFMWKVFDRESVSIEERDLIYYNEWIARPAGLYSVRSSDDGLTWDAPRRITQQDMAVRGKGVEMPDGSFIVAAYKYLPGCTVYVLRTTDRGESWEELAVIDHPNGCDEPCLLLTPSGKLVVFIRSDRFDINDLTSAPLLTAESHDGGRTWSEPVERPFYSPSPFEAIRLQSGRVLVTYGHRFPPFGIRAFLLDAECENWNDVEEIILRNDCEDEDIGYTSAVQLANGEIMVFHYYMESETGGYRYIAATTCKENTLP